MKQGTKRPAGTSRPGVQSRQVDRLRKPGGTSSAAETTSGSRGRILDAAAWLFSEYGFEQASMRQIAQEVDMIAGSIYHHFATKEEILHEIIHASLEEWSREFEFISQMPVDAELRLITSVLTRLSHLSTDWEVNAIINNESQFFRKREEFSYVDEIKAKTFKSQQGILNDGIEAGLFRPDIDVYFMVTVIARMLTAAAAWFRRGYVYTGDMPKRYTFDSVVDNYLDAILHMVRAPGRLEQPIPRDVCERLAGLQDQQAAQR